jgi:hypothetical protein
MATRAKPIVRLKDPKRFLVNEENQQLQQSIFETFVEWTTGRLIDEVFLSLMSVKSQFCIINSNKKAGSFSDPKQVEQDYKCNSGSGVLRRLYELQARYKMYRMVVFRPPPAFVILLKDLDERVKRELAKRDKDSRDFILKQTAERIFEQIDSRYFQLSAKPFLKVRLEK